MNRPTDPSAFPSATPALGRRRRRDAMLWQLLVAVPLALALVSVPEVMMAVYRTRADMTSAVQDAAYAAAVSGYQPASAAGRVAQFDLADECEGVSTHTDLQNFHRGGTVTVTIGCTVRTHVPGFRLLGGTRIRATATTPVRVDLVFD